VIIGAWLARRWSERTFAPVRLPFWFFSFLCGLLGAAFVVAVTKPGLLRDAEQALALRPYGLVLAGVALVGGVLTTWVARRRGVLAGVGILVITMVGIYVGLLLASPWMQRPSSKDIALLVRDRIGKSEPVYHYWAFFHDFVYYTGRPVGLVSYIDELEVQFMSPAERAARFIDETELIRQWSGPGRVWVLVRMRDQAHPKSVFSQPGFRYHLIAESRGLSLLSNQP